MLRTLALPLAGWNPGLTLRAAPGQRREKLTIAAFWAYRIFQRNGESDHIFRAGRLGQEFACDAYSQVEDDKLRFLRYNQDKLRADTYSGLQASMPFSLCPSNAPALAAA